MSSKAPPPNVKSNVPEFSVGELAFSLKKTLEDNFGRVRVRGELSRISIAGSGHMYSSLKDDQAVIDAVCWKGNLSRLSVRPEEGLEVICIGKISSYPKSSKYQLIIESMELAGEGALLKMLEDRRKKLAAEGLFAQERKKPLPFLPKTIGVVTSPTGAVIRDILHRLADRMPSHVIVWPVLVQGDGAADQITAAINGFNALSPNTQIPKPDLLIIARGGGSLEDLMAFNEESVVRAIADCTIPVISAVGHETDTTLCDFAADLRAPTPTGAAEMAVPVRANLMAQIMEGEQRLLNAVTRRLNDSRQRVEAQTRMLGNPAKLLEIKSQTLDHMTERLGNVFGRYLSVKREALITRAARITHPKTAIASARQNLDRWGDQLQKTGQNLTRTHVQRLEYLGKMLQAYSFENTLQRGFVVVRAENGSPVTTAANAQKEATLTLQYKDNQTVRVFTSKDAHTRTHANTPRPPPEKQKKPTDKDQQSLF